jgi:hypothetical protein
VISPLTFTVILAVIFATTISAICCITALRMNKAHKLTSKNRRSLTAHVPNGSSAGQERMEHSQLLSEDSEDEITIG